MAVIRRVPADTLSSEVILTMPIWPVLDTCVPPQSSRLTPSIVTIRTMSGYFSPKSIIAPAWRASASGRSCAATGTALEIDVRGKRLPATVTAMPFVPHRYHR